MFSSRANVLKKFHKMSRRIISLTVSLILLCSQTGLAQVATELNLSGYLAQLHYNPIDRLRLPCLRYFSYDNINNDFRIMLDKGDLKGMSGIELQDSARELLSYFLIGVTLPDESFWVNLRPDSADNIIDDYLAQTEVGKIFLGADLQLKKDTAKFTSPETAEGRQYWDKLYQKADQLFGSENITIPTLTRPWIVPGEVIIREDQGSVYIYKATLKVMLEQDHLKDSAVYNFSDPRLKDLNEYSSQLIRTLIIPRLTREINTSRRYAALRQVYYSLILARWFKARFYGKGGLYSSLINKRNLDGLLSSSSWSKKDYFKEYQKSFKEGEYNLRVPVNGVAGQSIRSYFSGGLDLRRDLAVPAAGSITSSPVIGFGVRKPAGNMFSSRVPNNTVALSASPSSQASLPETLQEEITASSPIGIEGKSPLLAFREIKQQAWLDGLNYEMLFPKNPGEESEFAKLIRIHGITGVTTNPSLILKYLGSPKVQERALALARERAKVSGEAPETIRKEVNFELIKELASLIIEEFKNAGVEGKLSIEIDPAYARNVEASIEEAKKLAYMLGRENSRYIMIKVPATVEGYKITEELTALGINVNGTLLFHPGECRSLPERLQQRDGIYRDFGKAYIRGLKRARAAGIDLNTIYSVASLFLSGWDVENIDKIPEDIDGMFANSIGIVSYNEIFQELFIDSPEFQELQAQGARVQDLLLASTTPKTSKFPASRQPKYSLHTHVAPVQGPHIVNTSDIKIWEHMISQGVEPKATIITNYEQARAIIGRMSGAVDWERVKNKLFEDKKATFEKDALTIKTTLDDLVQRALSGTTSSPVNDDRNYQEVAKQLRRDIITMLTDAGSGHPGGSLSIVEILTALYFNTMHYDSSDPKWADRDNLVLSKGHAAPALYATLALAGFISRDELSRLRKLGSMLEGHANTNVPGIEANTGILGQGLSVAAGLAVAAKLQGKEHITTYCILGDGETQKGQVSEAAKDIAVKSRQAKIGKVVAFLDNNGLQIDGEIMKFDTANFPEEWRSYGWDVIEVDGHNTNEIVAAIEQAKTVKDSPTIIITRTTKGQGVSFMEGKAGWHGVAPKPEERDRALAEIGVADQNLINHVIALSYLRNAEYKYALSRKSTATPITWQPSNTSITKYQPGVKNIATRAAAGDFFAGLPADVAERVVYITVDLKGSVQVAKAIEKTPTADMPVGIREAHAVGLATGLALRGYIPVVTTFDVFINDMVSQIRMASLMGVPIIYYMTHVGLGVGADGKTHQSETTPIIMSSIPNMACFDPADANRMHEALGLALQRALKGEGPSYVRGTRQSVPVLAPQGLSYPEADSYLLYSTSEAKPDLIIAVSGGAMAYRALEAAKQLAVKGKKVRVIGISRFDAIVGQFSSFRTLLEPNTPILTVQDASPDALGNLVSKTVTRLPKSFGVIRVGSLGFNKGMSFRDAEEEVAYATVGMNVDGIVRSGLELIESASSPASSPAVARASTLPALENPANKLFLDAWEDIQAEKFEEAAAKVKQAIKLLEDPKAYDAAGRPVPYTFTKLEVAAEVLIALIKQGVATGEIVAPTVIWLTAQGRLDLGGQIEGLWKKSRPDAVIISEDVMLKGKPAEEQAMAVIRHNVYTLIPEDCFASLDFGKLAAAIKGILGKDLGSDSSATVFWGSGPYTLEIASSARSYEQRIRFDYKLTYLDAGGEVRTFESFVPLDKDSVRYVGSSPATLDKPVPFSTRDGTSGIRIMIPEAVLNGNEQITINDESGHPEKRIMLITFTGGLNVMVDSRFKKGTGENEWVFEPYAGVREEFVLTIDLEKSTLIFSYPDQKTDGRSLRTFEVRAEPRVGRSSSPATVAAAPEATWTVLGVNLPQNPKGIMFDRPLVTKRLTDIAAGLMKQAREVSEGTFFILAKTEQGEVSTACILRWSFARHNPAVSNRAFNIPLPDRLPDPFFKLTLVTLGGKNISLGEAAVNLSGKPAATASSPMAGREDLGGIDLRSIPFTVQTLGNFGRLNFNLPDNLTLQRINLDEESRQIAAMINGGIIPSAQRVKEYILACYYKKELAQRIGDLISCLTDICRMQEEYAQESEPELKESLVLLDSFEGV